MQGTCWKTIGLTVALAVVLAWSVQAQQPHQQHHGGAQASTEQPTMGPGASDQPQMMQNMQGMMQGMQGMMEHMQEMMGNMQGMMGQGRMMGRRGMMTDADEDDADDMPMRMMGRHGRMGRMPGHGRRFMRHVERLLDQLDLTDEQETKVRSLVREHMKQAIRANADIEVKRLDLHDLLDAEPVDLAKVKALLQSISSQEVDLRLAHITLLQEIRNFLTPEQQKTLRSMRHRMMRGDKGMMGHGSMRGPGGMRSPGGMMGRGSHHP